MSLPAVPTCTWCELAADALTAAFDRCVVFVRFESTHDMRWAPIGIAYKPENAEIVETLQRAFTSSTRTGTPSEQSHATDRPAVRRLGASDRNSTDPLDALLINLGGSSVFRDVTRLKTTTAVDLVVECVNLSDSTDWLDEGFQDALRAAIGLIARRADLASEQVGGHAPEPLNLREVKVLDALTHGKTIAEIAGEMSRSTHTVRDYLKSMHKKIGASSRAELIARATGRM